MGTLWTRRGALILLALTSIMPGCGPVPTVHLASPPAAECEVLDLAENGCLLPWPSSRFQDPTSHAITQLPDDRMPVSDAIGTRVSTQPWSRRDGYSAMTSMITRIDGVIDTHALANWHAPVTDAHSVTVLLDTTAGAPMPVPHFAEIQEETFIVGDPMGDDVDPNFTTLYVRPMSRLQPAHHYVVGALVRRPDGTQPSSSATFAALRDGVPTDSAVLEARRPSFDADVLAPLDAAGVSRDRLVIAWDFWTGSDDDVASDLVAMTTQAQAMLPTLGCRIGTSVPVDAGLTGTIAYRVEGDFDVPYFLDGTAPASGMLADADTAGTAALHRDGNRPTTNGMVRARFVLLIPVSVASATTPASVRLIEYGHGLFTDETEIAYPHIATVLEGAQAIGIATDAYGLAAPDLANAGQSLLELNRFSSVADHALQGIVAQVLLPSVFVEHCAPQLAALTGTEGAAIDPAHFGWLGNSQGAIMGPTIAALEPHFDRLALGVGGISYPIMLPRSCDWPGMLADVLRTGYMPHIVRDLLMVMFASHWDRFEGATFAPRVTDRAILYQIARDDIGTPEVSGEIAARTMELHRLASSATSPWNVDPVAGGPVTRAFVSYAYPDVVAAPLGTGTPPLDACALGPCEMAHERVRRDSRAQSQIIAFFRDGTIIDTCDGSCTGTGPACVPD